MATLKEALEYAKMNPNSSFATALRSKIESGEADAQAQAEGIQLPGRQPEPNIAQTIAGSLLKAPSRLGQTAGAATIAGYNTLKGDGTFADNYGEASKLYEKSGQILGGNLFGENVQPAQNAEQIAGDIMQTGANLIPGATLGKGATTLAKIGTGVAAGAGTGGLIGAGQSMSENGSLQDVVTQGLIGAGIGGAIGGAIPGVSATANLAKIGAGKIANAPIVTGTKNVLESAGRTLKNIPENVATNVGEMQAKESVIKSIPSVTGQKAARAGIEAADINTLKEAVKTPEAKTLIQTVKDYASGISKTSPFEVVGKPIIERLKTLDNQVKTFASQLDTVANDLKGISIDDASKIQDSVMNGLNKLQVGIKRNGLDFVGSTLEGIGGSGKIIENVFNRLQTAKDAFDLHNLKKYIDANVSYGKTVEGLDASAERLLKSWRKAIDDTLDNQFADYNKVNTELSKRISPLEDLKSVLKNTDGMDTDLLSQKAGLLARRITSAAASNPEIRQVLRNLDTFTSKTGKTLGSVEKLQDLYNILNKYYDIAPKTGFQNLVKEGVTSAGGFTDQIVDTVKGFAGTTNAVRTKALENYLDELLNPAKPSTKANSAKATKAQIKNDIMGQSVPQTKKGASGKMGGFMQLTKDTSIPKELQPLAEEARKFKNVNDFLEEQQRQNHVLYRGNYGEKVGDNSFFGDFYGHAANYTDLENGGVVHGFVYKPEDVLSFNDEVFNAIRDKYKKLTLKQIEETYKSPLEQNMLGDAQFQADMSDKQVISYVKDVLNGDIPYSEISGTKNNDFLIPIMQKYAKEKGKNIVSFQGSDFYGADEYVVSDIKKLTNLNDLWNKANGEKMGGFAQISSNKIPKNIEGSVVQIVDTKTGKDMFFTIPKGQLAKYHNLIDDTTKGVAGKEIDGKIYHLTAKTPKQMLDNGFVFGGHLGDPKIKLGFLPKAAIGTAVATGALKAGVEYKKSKNK